MPRIRMHPKRQVTLPVSVVREADIKEDDKPMVTFVGGNFIMTPQKVEARKDNMS